MRDELKPINEAPKEIKAIIMRVIEHEKSKIYQLKPHGIKEDLINIRGSCKTPGTLRLTACLREVFDRLKYPFAHWASSTLRSAPPFSA